MDVQFYGNTISQIRFFFTVYLHVCHVCYFHLCDQTNPPSVGRGLDFISRMSVSPVWRRLGHIYSVSPPVIFPLYSDRRQIKERRRRENCIRRESVSRGRVAAVDSPWDRGSPSLSAKYLITPADTRRAGGNAAQNERPALGEGAAAAAGSSLKTGLLFKVFMRRLARRSTLPLNDDENTWRESSAASSFRHLLVSLKETNHHWFYRRGIFNNSS